MADISPDKFIPYFTEISIPMAFLVPTPTGMKKSIMDATTPIRLLLKSSEIHDYEVQKQGPENKVLIDAYFIKENALEHTQVSLYRPVTKQGDPRIWIYNLGKYCSSCNLLALFVIDNCIYIANMSNEVIADSLIHKGYFYDLLKNAVKKDNLIADELRNKIQDIHNRGFLRTITIGDPGVGDTLENALGIARNNDKNPDYKGIELKASRKRIGKTNRSNLFDQAPDWKTPNGMTEYEILDKYGYYGMSSKGIERFQLYCTLAAKKPNSQGLYLSYNEKKDTLEVNAKDEFVTLWSMDTLRSRLKQKHPATFWVKATVDIRENIEYFRYDHIKYTRNPNLSLFADLIDSGIVTVDFLMHLKENGKVRDHGFPFKIRPKDINMLFPEVIEYDLTK